MEEIDETLIGTQSHEIQMSFQDEKDAIIYGYAGSSKDDIYRLTSVRGAIKQASLMVRKMIPDGDRKNAALKDLESAYSWAERAMRVSINDRVFHDER